MYKHLSCAAFKIKVTTGSGHAGTCEKLHARSRIRLRQKAGVCASAFRQRGRNTLCITLHKMPYFYEVYISGLRKNMLVRNMLPE
jgi:hypothetical protein